MKRGKSRNKKHNKLNLQETPKKIDPKSLKEYENDIINPESPSPQKNKKKIDTSKIEKMYSAQNRKQFMIQIEDLSSTEFNQLSPYRLQRNFFLTDAVSLAKKLIGKIIVRKINEEVIKCRIVETEAYMAPEDKASHSYNNRKTDRTKPFWNTGGHLYVYLIYGINNCMNIIANDADKPQAVLIRAVEPISGLDLIKIHRNMNIDNNLHMLTNGPGKVSASLKIDRSYNEVDLCSSDEIFLLDEENDIQIDRSVRINIDYAEEYVYKPWRFFAKGNKYVSKVKIKYNYVDE